MPFKSSEDLYQEYEEAEELKEEKKLIILFKDKEDVILKDNLERLDVDYTMIDVLTKENILQTYKNIINAKIVYTNDIQFELMELNLYNLVKELNMLIDETDFYKDFSLKKIENLKIEEAMRIKELFKPYVFISSLSQNNRKGEINGL